MRQCSVISRRGLLLGGAVTLVTGSAGAGFLLADGGSLPGGERTAGVLGRCGGRPVIPATPGIIRSRTFASTRRRTDVTATIVLPAGTPGATVRGLPVAIALHGRFGSGDSLVSSLDLDRFLTDRIRSGGTEPYAIVAVDGGANGYWHPRRTGDDPQAMIIDELLPWLGGLGARTERIGIIGWSMGGYGALLLAERLGAGRVAAVVAASPGLYPSYAAVHRVNRKAFDDAADFARNDVMAGLDRLAGIPVQADCGDADRFAPMTRRLRQRLTEAGMRPAGQIGQGCHDEDYWRRRLPAQLGFLGTHLYRATT